MSDDGAVSDPSTWDPQLDAVIAAPAHHKVLFENDRLRVLDVTLEPDDEEPVHHHRWPSVFVFDQIEGPIHDITPEGETLPPNRDVLVAAEGVGRQGLPGGSHGAAAGGTGAERIEQDPPRRPHRDEDLTGNRAIAAQVGSRQRMATG